MVYIRYAMLFGLPGEGAEVKEKAGLWRVFSPATCPGWCWYRWTARAAIRLIGERGAGEYSAVRCAAGELVLGLDW